jgi:lipoyl(octanoyl) transferase
VSDSLSIPRSLPPNERALAAYLLGEVEFDLLLSLQRRLIYDVSGDVGDGAMVICEHSCGITVGREGSLLHIRLSPRELVAREWSVRWVARGGGVMLHVPGQVAVYPILPLNRLNLSSAEYVHELCEVLIAVLQLIGVHASRDDRQPGVIVGRRRIAHVGVAVRNGVSSFGAILNVSPNLELFRGIDCDGRPGPMTSVEREAPNPIRTATIRQLLLDEIARRFEFHRVSVFHTHPAVVAETTCHAPVAARR